MMEVRELAIRATRTSGMQKLEELYPLVCLVSLNPPCRVVELGSARGGTFLIWCKLATEYGVLVSVDIEQAEVDCERMRGFARPHQKVHLVQGDTHDPAIRQQVEDLTGYVDLLHIDADHSEAAVRADWEDYSPLVCPGGLVVFHDISDGGPIGQLWSELAERFWSIKFIAANGNDGWGGIGVLRI
jgi:cephalosporin hydroxylase